MYITMSAAELTPSIDLLSKDGVAPISQTNDDCHQAKAPFKVRSYQLEMLEESLKRNIIVTVRNAVTDKDFANDY